MTKWDYLIESDAVLAKALKNLRSSPIDVDLWSKALVEAKHSGLLLVLWVNLGRLWLPRTVTDARIASPGETGTVAKLGDLELETVQFHGWGPFNRISGSSRTRGNLPYRIGTVKRSGAEYVAIDDADLSTWENSSKKLVGMNPFNMVWSARHRKSDEE